MSGYTLLPTSNRGLRHFGPLQPPVRVARASSLGGSVNASNPGSSSQSLHSLAGSSDPELHYSSLFTQPGVFKTVMWLGTYSQHPPLFALRTALWSFGNVVFLVCFSVQFVFVSTGIPTPEFSFPAWAFTGCTWLLCVAVFVNSLQIPKFDFKSLAKSVYGVLHPGIDKIALAPPIMLKLTAFMWFILVMGFCMSVLLFGINLNGLLGYEGDDLRLLIPIYFSAIWPPFLLFVTCSLCAFLSISFAEVELMCDLVERNFAFLLDARGLSGDDFHAEVDRFLEAHVETLVFLRTYSDKRKWQVALLGVGGFLFSLGSALVTVHTIQGDLDPSLKATTLASTLVGNLIGCVVAIVPAYIYTKISGEYLRQVENFHHSSIIKLQDSEFFEKISYYLSRVPLQVDLFNIPLTFPTFLRLLIPFFASTLLVLLQIVGLI